MANHQRHDRRRCGAPSKETGLPCRCWPGPSGRCEAHPHIEEPSGLGAPSDGKPGAGAVTTLPGASTQPGRSGGGSSLRAICGTCDDLNPNECPQCLSDVAAKRGMFSGELR